MGTARTHCPDCESQAIVDLAVILSSPRVDYFSLLRLPVLVARAQGGRRARHSRCLRQAECRGGEEQGRLKVTAASGYRLRCSGKTIAPVNDDSLRRTASPGPNATRLVIVVNCSAREALAATRRAPQLRQA
jgi:hypothetical protein